MVWLEAAQAYVWLLLLEAPPVLNHPVSLSVFCVVYEESAKEDGNSLPHILCVITGEIESLYLLLHCSSNACVGDGAFFFLLMPTQERGH